LRKNAHLPFQPLELDELSRRDFQPPPAKLILYPLAPSPTHASLLTTTVLHDLIKNGKSGALAVCLPMEIATPAVPVSIVTSFVISDDVMFVILFTPHPRLSCGTSTLPPPFLTLTLINHRLVL